jgi:hypothetical protein
MEKLINRIQQQLNENHYVEKEDIQAILNECKEAREMCEAWRGLYYEIGQLKQTDK